MPARFSMRQAFRSLWGMKGRARTSREWTRVTMVLPQPVKPNAQIATTTRCDRRPNTEAALHRLASEGKRKFLMRKE